MICITLNGQTRELSAGQTLADLIAALDAPPQARAGCLLREGDAVFTFQPITGG